MTMYYTKAEMDYVEDQRMRRVMEEAAKATIDLVKDEDGIHRLKKDGENWQPSDTSDNHG